MDRKATVSAYVDAFNAGDWDRIAELFTSDARIAGVLGSAPLADALPIWRELREGMDMRLEIKALAEEGDTVVARLAERGRHVGRFRGLAGREPSNKPYEVLAMEWFEFAGGRIARRWGARDFDSIRRQVEA
jgi:predicted ester cyclase